jgi:GAF domain-containing protein
MSTTYFKQDGQTVKNQTNITGDGHTFGTFIAGDNISNAQSPQDFIKMIEALRKQVSQITEKGQLEEEVAEDVKHQLKQAAIQAKKPEPEKSAVTKRLTQAKELITNLAAAGGIGTGIAKLIELAGKIF